MNGVPLLWEYVEEILPSSTFDDALLLVGRDLVAQSFEIRDEINFFLAFVKDGTCSGRPFCSVLPLVPTGLQDLRTKASDFACAYHKEICSQDEEQDASNSLSEVHSLDKAVVELRKSLKEEASILKEYVHNLQSALLDNLNIVPNSTGDGEECNQKSERNSDDIFEVGDTQTPSAYGSMTRVPISDTEPEGLNRLNWNPHLQSTSFSPTAASSASVPSYSPLRLNVNISPSNVKRSSDAGKTTQLLKRQERLSPCSKILQENGSPLQPRRTVGRSVSSRTPSNSSDDKTAPCLPPLWNDRCKPLLKCDRGDRSTHKITTSNALSLFAQQSGLPVQGCFISAQRFRPTVLRTRQELSQLRGTNDASTGAQR